MLSREAVTLVWVMPLCCAGAREWPHQSSSLESSTLVWFSPFLYSRGQSSSRMRGLAILRRMRPGATTSFWNMTPFSTRQSSMDPPGSFSTCRGALYDSVYQWAAAHTLAALT